MGCGSSKDGIVMGVNKTVLDVEFKEGVQPKKLKSLAGMIREDLTLVNAKGNESKSEPAHPCRCCRARLTYTCLSSLIVPQPSRMTLRRALLSRAST